jgi:dTDP-4-amino-4,6-dideoxygalactose transaminase
MTEFSAAIGRVALRRLIEDNKRRRDNHEILTHELAGSLAKLVQPRAEVYAVYYSNLILLDGDLDFQARVLHQINQKGIPLKRTWQPLNLHSHFKREHMVNNFTPWDFMHGYTFTEPSQLSLAKSQEYQTSRIFELDCHPLVGKQTVHAAGSIIRAVLRHAA